MADMEDYVSITRTKQVREVPDLRKRRIRGLCLKKFDTLPPWLGELGVKDLTISTCSLPALPDLRRAKSITSLNFVDCDMPALPPEAFAPGLRELSVFYDRNTLLTEYPPLALPDPLPRCPALKELSISGYVVSSIPRGIVAFPALETLVVYPFVREVSPALAKLGSLSEVNFLYCDFADFAGTLAILAKLPLESLTLSNIIVDATTERPWRKLGKTLREVLARSFAMVAPGARGKGPQVKRDFDVAKLQAWLPKAKIRT